mgnify:CR=1 FL=1|jgi:hypothetical protein
MSCRCEHGGDQVIGGMNHADTKPAIHKKAHAARILLPGILLMLIPKCPLCLAAWIAVGTGIGISFTVAAWLRWSLIAIGIISLCYLIFKSTVQLWKNSCSSSGKT